MSRSARFARPATSRRVASHDAQQTEQPAIASAAAASTPNLRLEALEQRRLLTTVVGGEIFEFQDLNGNPVRVILQGDDAAIELIGASLDEDGNPRLNQIPGVFVDQAGNILRDVFGGYGGIDGVEPANVLRQFLPASQQSLYFDNAFTDVSRPNSGFGPSIAARDGTGNDNINITAIAAKSTGQTFGFNVADLAVGDETRRVVELVSISNFDGRTVVGYPASEIAGDILTALGIPVDFVPPPDDPANPPATPPDPESQLERVESIVSADFDSRNDRFLYFVANVQRGGDADPVGGDEEKLVSHLMYFDALTGEVIRVSNFGSNLTSDDEGAVNPVSAISFLPNGNMLVWGTRGGDQTGLFTLERPFGDDALEEAAAFTSVQIGIGDDAEAIEEIAAMEVIPYDSEAVYIVSDEVLYRVDIATGVAVQLGELPDPDDTREGVTARGSNINALVWNPALPNFFAQRDRDLSIPNRGTLLAIDTETDELLIVDQRERIAETNLFRIEGLSSSQDTSLRIAELTESPLEDIEDDEINRVMIPYSGTVGALNALAQQAPDGTTPGGTGNVLIGIRSQAENLENVLQNSLPIDSFIGAIPPVGLAENVRPGIFFPGSVQNVLIGGTITGEVRIVGSTDLFYAGNILTGDGEGLLEGAAPAAEFINNFRIDGDARNILVRGGIGSTQDPRTGFRTGTDIFIGGRAGQIKTGAAFSGSAQVFGDRGVPRVRTNQQELEVIVDDETLPFETGIIDTAVGITTNDTFETAQLLYTTVNGNANNDVIVVDGVIQNSPDFGDVTDYYGVALLAGQTVEFNWISLDFALSVGVFDPDGRLIYTGESNDNPGATFGESFLFTAQRPGVYRIVVTDDEVELGGEAAAFTLGEQPYTFALRNVSNVVLGGVVSQGPTHLAATEGGEYAFRVRRGDMGALDAGGPLTTDFSAVEVLQGNLRSIEATNVGVISNGLLNSGLALNVPGGSVGLLRTTDASANGLMFVGIPGVARSFAGIDFQTIDAASLLFGDVQANRGIGNVLAGTMGTLTPSRFVVNADQAGRDGFINLFDVAGDFGSLQGGGPRIVTNEGGNVRYIRVGGEIYRDAAFGSGTPQQLTLTTGEDLLFTDDSGAQVRLKAGSSGGGNPILLPGFPQLPPAGQQQGQISFTPYPIFGSGGSVIVNATLSGNVEVRSFAEGRAQSVEISELVLQDPGAAPVDLNGRLQFLPSANQLRVKLDGNAAIDVFQVTGNNINSLVNQTGGEIVNVNAATIGTIAAQSIGVASNTRGPAQLKTRDTFLGRAAVEEIYPFNDQPFGIYSAGGVVSLEANDALGNVYSEGIIQRVIANADGRSRPGVFEGIAGPIVSESEIREVNIGEGLASSGSGNVGFAGIYAAGPIGQIVNQGPGSDLRGDVISATSIGEIILDGGSIIGADILVVSASLGVAPDGSAVTPLESAFLAGQEVLTTTLVVSPPSFFNEPATNLGPILIGNGGGITGSYFQAGGIDLVEVMGGFGVFSSIFSTVGDGYFRGIRTDGLGIRNVTIDAGARMDYLIAEGTDGKLLKSTNFSPTVRPSDGGASFDPFTGRAVAFDNDLNLFLGTSAGRFERISGVTNQGIIDNVTARGSGELGRVQAFQIQGRSILPPSSEFFPMSFTFGESVTSIRTFGPIVGLRVLTGGTREILSTSNIDNLYWEGAGLLRNVEASGTIERSTTLVVKGNNGRIEHLRTGRDMLGTVRATQRLGTVNVGRNLGSPSLETSGRIDNLRVGNNVLSGTFVRARRAIGNLFVGGDVSVGAVIRAGSYGNVDVDGVIGGSIVTL